MIDIVVRRQRRHPQNRARTGPMRLHIVSFRFAAEGPLRRMTTVLVQGRMDQCAAMKQAAAEAGTRGPEPWLTDINTVPPLRATPALDAICRRHTAFPTFLALLTQPAGYRPSIRLDLMGQEGAVLARAYDRVQAKWGDPRRAFVSGNVPRVKSPDEVGHATA